LSHTDVLALLHRSPDTFWTPQAIAHRLGLHEDAVKRTLEALLGAGLIVEASGTIAYRFAPRERGALLAFADAFKLKKE
jgi:predicted ArsR family transcriptional regulator